MSSEQRLIIKYKYKCKIMWIVWSLYISMYKLQIQIFMVMLKYGWNFNQKYIFFDTWKRCENDLNVSSFLKILIIFSSFKYDKLN